MLVVIASNTAFAGSATLLWTAPTLNEDGTPLTDLAGYNIYMGCTASGQYELPPILGIPASITTIEAVALPEGGDCFFVGTAYNESGIESQYSGEAVKFIEPTGTLPDPVQNVIIEWQQTVEPPSNMTIPVVGNIQVGKQAGSGSTVTVNKPTGLSNGDLILLLHTGRAPNPVSKTINYPTGFTLQNEVRNDTTDTQCAVLTRVVDGTEGATFSVDYDGDRAAQVLWAVAVTGVDETTPIDVMGADQAFTTDATSFAVTGVTTVTADALAMYLLAADGGDTNPHSVSGTGWSETADDNSSTSSVGSGASWGEKDMASTGATGTATVSTSVSDMAVALQFALRPEGATNPTASGTPSLTAIEASGTAKVHRAASGTPSLTEIESAGTAKVHRAASGGGTLTALEASGTAEIPTAETASGGGTLTALEASGTAKVARQAAGGSTLEALEAAGTAKVHRAASGTPALTALEAAGTAATQGIATASGGGTLTALEAAGTAKVHRAASGTPALTALEAAGTAATQGTATASGGGTLAALVAAGDAYSTSVKITDVNTTESWTDSDTGLIITGDGFK